MRDKYPQDNKEKKILPEAEYAVLVEDVWVSYPGGDPVLKEVNLALPGGEFITILGPNGAGKSTLFQLLMGLLPPLQGRVLLFGKDVQKNRFCQTVAYMPQYQEIDWDYPIQVWDVVLLGRYGHMLQRAGLGRFLPPFFSQREHALLVKEALNLVDMFQYRHRPIRSLSGGEKKRVFLARSLVQKAQILLLDEPLAGVDRGSQEMILEVLALQQKEGKTIILITHDLEAVQPYTQKLVVMDQTVIASGPLEELKEAYHLSGRSGEDSESGSSLQACLLFC